ncbi:type II toxin-antitoxin system Phd/YefM family antitoxin [Deinococcus planocerae]|uniref:type II toxin-antitoxin system Phd/YefM family antitoxin n=1 Tax=Deinococcus planocerae TaxID=1737569 RepID=UPI000C7EC77A|nr:type II toxin-antitoxin system Phd/YefM family antitoxin [Deinococcus planocerae]
MTVKPKIWKLEDAKAQFSDLVRRAQAGQPQLVTRRGQPAVVILDASQFREDETAVRSGWSTFEAAPKIEEFEPVRLPGTGREVDL